MQVAQAARAAGWMQPMRLAVPGQFGPLMAIACRENNGK
jgi:hypothetical protein